jgi:hypothetical protein
MLKYKSSKWDSAISEASDILDAIGQRSEKKAKKWVIYFNELYKQKELEKNQLRRSRLKKSRKRKQEYYKICAEMLHDMVIKLERPVPGFVVGADFNEKGIYVELWDPYGRTYKRAIKPSGTPKYDLPAILTLVGSTEDTMWNISDEKVTSGGIFLP